MTVNFKITLYILQVRKPLYLTHQSQIIPSARCTLQCSLASLPAYPGAIWGTVVASVYVTVLNDHAGFDSMWYILVLFKNYFFLKSIIYN